MNRTVFVGDLSFFCNEIQLMRYFSSAGKISSVEIKRGSCGESLLHGFIKFETDQGAMAAVRMLHGVKFLGRRLIVNSTNSKAPKKTYDRWHKLTIHFSSSLEVEVNEEFLDHLCSPFGDVGDTVVRSHVALKAPESGVTGYAVVFFISPAAAQQAYEFLHTATLHGVTFNCSISTHSAVLPMGSGNKVFLHSASQSPRNNPHLQTLSSPRRPPQQQFSLGFFGEEEYKHGLSQTAQSMVTTDNTPSFSSAPSWAQPFSSATAGPALSLFPESEFQPHVPSIFQREGDRAREREDTRSFSLREVPHSDRDRTHSLSSMPAVAPPLAPPRTSYHSAATSSLSSTQTDRDRNRERPRDTNGDNREAVVIQDAEEARLITEYRRMLQQRQRQRLVQRETEDRPLHFLEQPERERRGSGREREAEERGALDSLFDSLRLSSQDQGRDREVSISLGLIPESTKGWDLWSDNSSSFTPNLSFALDTSNSVYTNGAARDSSVSFP